MKTLKSRAGFSLTELTVVAAIILIVSGLSLPSLTRVIDIVRVKTAAQQAAFLYQQARIRATQDDTYYNVVSNGPSSLCLDLNGNGVCDPNDPATALSGGAILSNAGIPVRTTFLQYKKNLKKYFKDYLCALYHCKLKISNV